MLSERILKLPGFLYQIGNNYYYLGKWICKECTDQAATDCVTMYQMCRAGKEEPETNTYFQKLRAYSDFALEVPYNPSKIAADMKAIWNLFLMNSFTISRNRLIILKKILPVIAAKFFFSTDCLCSFLQYSGTKIRGAFPYTRKRSSYFCSQSIRQITK